MLTEVHCEHLKSFIMGLFLTRLPDGWNNNKKQTQTMQVLLLDGNWNISSLIDNCVKQKKYHLCAIIMSICVYYNALIVCWRLEISSVKSDQGLVEMNQLCFSEASEINHVVNHSRIMKTSTNMNTRICQELRG